MEEKTQTSKGQGQDLNPEHLGPESTYLISVLRIIHNLIDTTHSFMYVSNQVKLGKYI